MNTLIKTYLGKLVALLLLLSLFVQCNSNDAKEKRVKRELFLNDSIARAAIIAKEERVTPITKQKYAALTLGEQLLIQDSLNSKLCNCFVEYKKDAVIKMLKQGASLYSSCSVTREEFDGLKAIGFFFLTAGTSVFVRELNRSNRTYEAAYIDFVLESGNLKWLKKIAQPEYGWNVKKVDAAATQDTAVWNFLMEQGLPIEAFSIPHDVASSPEDYCQHRDYTALRYLLRHNYPVNKVQQGRGYSTLFAQYMFTNSCDDTVFLKQFIQKGANLQPFKGKSWLEVVLKREYTGMGGQAIFWEAGGEKSEYAKNFLTIAPRQFEYLITHGVPASSYPDLMRDLTTFCQNDDWLPYFKILKKHKAISFTEGEKAVYVSTLRMGSNPRTTALMEKW